MSSILRPTRLPCLRPRTFLPTIFQSTHPPSKVLHTRWPHKTLFTACNVTFSLTWLGTAALPAEIEDGDGEEWDWGQVRAATFMGGKKMETRAKGQIAWQDPFREKNEHTFQASLKFARFFFFNCLSNGPFYAFTLCHFFASFSLLGSPLV